MKIAEPVRLAKLSVPFFQEAGIELTPSPLGFDFLASTLPIATGSVDRLDQVPARLSFLFNYSVEAALPDDAVRAEMTTPSAHAVVQCLASELLSTPRLDRERFRAIAAVIKGRTGQKGRALLHPIRIALTGRAEGPELDLAVPAIERGADLPPDAGIAPIVGCGERAQAFVSALNALRE